MKLFNTLSKEKEEFKPLDPRIVRMYVCGPTVYATPHIGNARPAVVFDVLFRLLRFLYPNVNYINNITDINDKIYEKAEELNIPIRDLIISIIDQYKLLMKDLNILSPTHQPRVSEYTKEITAFIQKLVDSNHAYVAEGHVLFDVNSFKNYGALSRKKLEDLIDGARVEVAPYKKDPRDFVLWKPSLNGEPFWRSPWSKGRPGWHIECSTLIEVFLGNSIDIHGGGIDLTFPHHENEIAQSECLSHKPLANYWMHNGHVTVNGQKMSKSLGNTILLDELMKQHDPQAVRLALLSTQYRQPLDWTEERITSSASTLKKFFRSIENVEEGALHEGFWTRFLDALKDDLNTPLAFSIMHEIVTDMSDSGKDLDSLKYTLKCCLEFLGFKLKKADQNLSQEILDLLEERQNARSSKDFKKSDELRDQLASLNILVEDTKEGQKWTKLN